MSAKRRPYPDDLMANINKPIKTLCKIYGCHWTTARRWKSELTDYHPSTSKHPVLQYSKDGEFIARYESMQCATEAMYGTRGAISKNVRGITRSAYGYIWRSEC